MIAISLSGRVRSRAARRVSPQCQGGGNGVLMSPSAGPQSTPVRRPATQTIIQQNMFYCWSSSLSISSVDICESYGVIDLHPANVSLSQCGELRRAGNRTAPPAGCSQPDLSNIDTIEMETISQTAGRRRLVELLQTVRPLIHHPAVAITEIQTQGFVACGTRKQRSLRRIGGEEWLRNE